MVLATANEVGCAQNVCLTSNPPPVFEFLNVCLFRRIGGYLTDRPYKSGMSCSECPNGFACERKQCFKKPSPVTHSPSPTTSISTMLSQAANSHLPKTNYSKKSSLPNAADSATSPAPSTSVATGVFPVVIINMISFGLCLIV
uniref:SCP domain-containing protein n=1 Tax=Mesocestoides corti TaxID=53468 RepID=A0A5K3G163_MESCO